jgi:hypothetical protein
MISTPLTIKNAQQELRQLQVKEPLKKITVQVCREDFPLIRGFVDVEFYPSAPQQVWSKFISDVCKTLKLQFVDSILERGDKAYVNRIMRLKDGADYLVRQRENSAVLEVLNTGIQPMDNSWEITNHIISAKRDIELGTRSLAVVHNRIKHLVSQSLTSATERATAQQILAAETPREVVNAICLLYMDKKNATAEDISLASISIRYDDVKKFDQKIDIVTLHRLALETLSRMAIGKNIHPLTKVLICHLSYAILRIYRWEWEESG